MSMHGTTVLIAPSSFAERDPEPRRLLAEAGVNVVHNPYGRRLTREELVGLLRSDVRGIIAGLEPLDAAVLRGSSLQVVSRCGSGLSNVDVATAAELGIDVFTTPDGPTLAVAELTIAALLSLLRMLPEMDRELHAGRWSKRIGRQLNGRTVAVVGCGRIGRRVTGLLEAFGARVLPVDPSDPHAVPLDDALREADVVTLHCSGESTVIGRRELRLTKPGVLVLNAARGGVLDEDALREALDDRRVAGAWLDAFTQEPYAGPLAGYPNVLLTPHAASYTAEARLAMEVEAVENLLGALERRAVAG